VGVRQDADRDGRGFGIQAPGPRQDIGIRCDLIRVAQGLRTTREQQALPESRYGSKVSARGTAVLTPLLAEYIIPHLSSVSPPPCYIGTALPPVSLHIILRGIMYDNAPRSHLLVLSYSPLPYFLVNMTHSFLHVPM
jgi:hypothetical protein